MKETPPAIVLAVHGFPEHGSQPQEQLEPLRQGLKLPQARWRAAAWIGTERRDLGQVIRLLRDRAFGSTYVSTIHSEVESVLQAEPDSPLVIIAYSLGGLLVYRWLAELATASMLARIPHIFCLASPVRFLQPEQRIYFQHLLNHPITVREPSVQFAALKRNLTEHQLTVFIAGQDRTILKRNASFGLFRSGLGLVEQINVPTADHLSIIAHEDVCTRIGMVL